MNKLFIVSSVSGSGKTTLVDYLVNELNITKLKTCTTRAVRPEETGDEYYFMDVDTFDKNVKDGLFIEHSIVYGNKYGLLYSELDRSKVAPCIIILDVQGAEKATSFYPEAETIFIDPPDIDILMERLLKRNTGSNDCEARIAMLHQELDCRNNYKYIIKNGSLDYMKEQIYSLVTGLLNA